MSPPAAPPADPPPLAAARDHHHDHRLGRFGLSATPLIQQLLKDAAQHPSSSQELKSDCEQYAAADTVPWKLVREACAALRRDSSSSAAPSTSADDSQQQQQHQQMTAVQACAGSTLVLPLPPARQRSAALQQRLAKLQEQLDSQQYAAMVADVTHDEQAAAAAREDPFFPTTKLQLSFGLHVVVTMGTFFALGYYAGLFALRSQAWAAACGCVGLVCGLLLETTLLIVRTNMPVPLDQKYAHLLDKSWDSRMKQQQQQQQPGGKQALAAAHNVPPAAPKQQGGAHQQQQLRRRRA